MDWYLIQPSITAVAEKKFSDGHYADSVESALKEVNKRVREHVKSLTGEERDGASLMNHAFSIARPLIPLADLHTETGRNIQQGYMQIFSGAMIGIRNPKAHENITIDEARAIHFLYLASLLMGKLDEVGVPPVPAAPDESESLSNFELKQRAGEKLRRAERELEMVYSWLQGTLEPERWRSLEKAQKLWLLFHDQHAEMVADGYRGGTAQGLIHTMELEKLTRVRTAELKRLYQEEERG